MAGFGDILRQARERKGIDLSTAASRLRVREDILRAIEQSDFVAMPPRGYARNMIAGYARYLGLDAIQITRQYLDELRSYQSRGQSRQERDDYSAYGQYAQYAQRPQRETDQNQNGSRASAQRYDRSGRGSGRSRRTPSDISERQRSAQRRSRGSSAQATRRSRRSGDRSERNPERRGDSRSQGIRSFFSDRASRDEQSRSSRANSNRRSRSSRSNGQGRGSQRSYGPQMPAVYAGRNSQDTSRGGGRNTRNGFASHPNDLPMNNGHLPSIYTDSQESILSDPRVRYVVAGIILIVLVVILCFALFGRSSSTSQGSTPNMPVTSLDEDNNEVSDDEQPDYPKSFTFTYSVPEGTSTWTQVIIDGETQQAEVVNGPSTQSFDCSGTLQFICANPTGVTAKQNDTDLTLNATSTGVDLTLSYTDFIQQWAKDNPRATVPSDVLNGTSGDSNGSSSGQSQDSSTSSAGAASASSGASGSTQSTQSSSSAGTTSAGSSSGGSFGQSTGA